MMLLTPELIEKLDKYEETPASRAAKVYEILRSSEDMTQYDLYCFAVEMLGAGAVNGELKYTEASIRQLSKDFYFAHYLRVAEGITKWQTGQSDADSTTSNGPSSSSSESSPTK